MKLPETTELALSVSEVIASEKAEAEAMAIAHARFIEDSEDAFLGWLEKNEYWDTYQIVWDNIKKRQAEALEDANLLSQDFCPCI